MTLSGRGFAAVAAVLLCALARPSIAGEYASPWAQGFHSRVRLVAGGAENDRPSRLAGLVMELDRGFKTYWRHPGESGLPPSLDWTGSENLLRAEVLWPAPRRFEDAGGIVHGYADGVLLPVRVTPADPTKPVRLSLKLDYGVCREICIPGSAQLTLNLASKATDHRAAIEAAVAQVPKPTPIGDPGELSITGVAPHGAGEKAMIAVTARTPGDATLFVEAPEGWYLAAGRMQPAAQAGANGLFLLEILERPRDAADTLDLRLTLVAGERAIETSASLDTASLPR